MGLGLIAMAVYVGSGKIYQGCNNEKTASRQYISKRVIVFQMALRL